MSPATSSAASSAAGAAGDTELVQLEQHVPFTMVENAIIQTITDYVALGLYLDMRSRPRGWRVNLSNMARNKKQGRDSLSAAMKQLIELGLVFRVKFQRPGGQWATRIYVAQRPVTIEELLEVRESYRQRCSIVTSTQLTAAANPPRRPQAVTANPEPASPVKPLVTPTDGFPTVGEPVAGDPTSGRPEVGEPEPSGPMVGETAAKNQEERINLPPPTPSNGIGAAPQPGEEEEDVEDKIVNDNPEHRSVPEPDTAEPALMAGTDEVVHAVAAAWSNLGRRDLQRLSPAVSAALKAGVSPEAMTLHLTTNTGGVRSPLHVLLARCENHPSPPPAVSTPSPWCGDCLGPQHRWVEVGPSRHPMPCPRCNDKSAIFGTASGPGFSDLDAPVGRDRDQRHIGDLIAQTREALRNAAEGRA